MTEDTPNNFDEWFQQQKNFQISLWKSVAGTSLLSLLAVIAQWDKFDVSFKAITETVGVVFGMGAILTVYLSAHETHPSKTPNILRGPPPCFSVGIFVRFAASGSLFIYYYYLAGKGSYFCLAPMALATYLFFAAITKAFDCIVFVEKRRKAWESLQPDEQQKHREWEKKFQAKGERLEEMRKDTQAQDAAKSAKIELREQERKTRRQDIEDIKRKHKRLKAFFWICIYLLSCHTYFIRRRFGLWCLTSREINIYKLELFGKRQAAEMFKRMQETN